MTFIPKSLLHREFINFMNYSTNNFYRNYPNFKRDKLVGYNLVQNIVNCPQIYKLLANINQLTTEILNNIPSNNFVIKATKGRQADRVICVNRNSTNPNEYRDLMRSKEWLSTVDFITHCRSIIPFDNSFKIIIEEFIGDGISIPIDYKVYVVKNKAKLIGIYSRGNTQQNFRSFFTPDWTHIPTSELYYTPKFPDISSIDEIENFATIEVRNKLLEIAEKLSVKINIKICRFDFYCIGDKIYFGEITPICGGLAYHALKPLALKILFPPNIQKWYRNERRRINYYRLNK
jgi:hypothetical protein